MRGWPTLRPLYADVAQLVEATDLSSVKCGFESHHRYHIRLRQVSLQELVHASVLFLQLPPIWPCRLCMERTPDLQSGKPSSTLGGATIWFCSSEEQNVELSLRRSRVQVPSESPLAPAAINIVKKCGSSMRGLDMTSRLIRASLRSLRQWAFGRSTKMYPAKKDKDHIICRGHIVVSMRH